MGIKRNEFFFIDDLFISKLYFFFKFIYIFKVRVENVKMCVFNFNICIELENSLL